MKSRKEEERESKKGMFIEKGFSEHNCLSISIQ